MGTIESSKRWGLAVAAAVCASAFFSSSAGAALIGPRNISDAASDGSYAGGCTYSNVQLSEGKVRSPFTGEIERWRVNIGEPHDAFVDDGPLRLQVLKRTANQPGVVNDEFQAVRQTGEQSVTPGGEPQAFNSGLRIRKGQFIGVDIAADTEVQEKDVSPAYLFFWCPSLTPAAPVVDPTFKQENVTLLFNATVKR